jgi:hypothetical protein
VEIAIDLLDLGEQLLRQRLRRDRPGISAAALEAEVTKWLRKRPGAERGDADGRVVRWPRRRRVGAVKSRR